MAYHKKTGSHYRIIGTAVDATNGREENELMVLYERNGKLFVRKLSEFREKFTGWEFDLGCHSKEKED